MRIRGCEEQTQITGCGLMVRHLTTVTVKQFRNQGIAGSSPVSQEIFFFALFLDYFFLFSSLLLLSSLWPSSLATEDWEYYFFLLVVAAGSSPTSLCKTTVIWNNAAPTHTHIYIHLSLFAYCGNILECTGCVWACLLDSYALYSVLWRNIVVDMRWR